jgi:hypothetical protein
MKINSKKYIVALTLCWIFANGCCTKHEASVEQSGDVRITKQPVNAEWQVIQIANQSGLPMRQLAFDNKIWLRETDSKRDGKVDDVRIRLYSGEYVEIKDTNGSGIFRL